MLGSLLSRPKMTYLFVLKACNSSPPIAIINIPINKDLYLQILVCYALPSAFLFYYFLQLQQPPSGDLQLGDLSQSAQTFEQAAPTGLIT
jgi:hypothetical protein